MADDLVGVSNVLALTFSGGHIGGLAQLHAGQFSSLASPLSRRGTSGVGWQAVVNGGISGVVRGAYTAFVCSNGRDCLCVQHADAHLVPSRASLAYAFLIW